MLLLFLSTNPIAPAQQRTRSDHVLKTLTVVKISVSGLSRYKEADVIAVSGLRAGTQVTSDDLQAASDRLGATGAFAHIEYRFIGVPTGVSVVFRVKETADVLPVIFDNFVWFLRDELIRQVHAIVPLFNGMLPVAGDTQEQVRAALQRLLAARNIPGQVILQHEAELGGVVRGVIYRVEGAEVVMTVLGLEGVQQLDPALLQELVNRLVGLSYLSTFLRDFPVKNFRPLYWKRGYLEVAFDEPRVSVAAREGNRTSVSVTFPIREGRPFRFAGVAWTGNTVFPADDLSRNVELSHGQVADATKFEYELGKVRALYGSRGYMGVKLVPKHVLSASGEARFDVAIEEGEIFRMGSLEILAPDLELTTRQRLHDAWKIRPGVIYDSSYSKQYLADSRPLLPRGSTWEFTFREEMDDKRNIVNLTIVMKPAGQPPSR